MNSRLEQKARGSGSSDPWHGPQTMDIRKWENDRRAEDGGRHGNAGSFDDNDEEDDVYRLEKEI